MAIEFHIMFHVLLLALSLVISCIVLSAEKSDFGDNFTGIYILGLLFFFVPIELIYWILWYIFV